MTSEEIDKHVLADYLVVKKLGSGAYGHVWKVLEKSTKRIFALKKVFDAFQHATDAQRTYREIRVLFETRHPNVVVLQKVVPAENDRDLYLVFQAMEADLHSAVSDSILQEVHFKFILAQVLRALKYLHSAGLIHRDIKPSNILLNSDCQAKLCDFGLARTLVPDLEGAVLTEEVATKWYRAPEVLLGSKHYGHAADLWSVGCVLAEMLRGKPIFSGDSVMDQLERIVSFTGIPSEEDILALQSDTAAVLIRSLGKMRLRPLREWLPKCSEEARQLVASLLQFNPNKRLTAAQSLRHPYLRQFISPAEQTTSKKLIQPEANDNVKLSVREYKALINTWISTHYAPPKRPDSGKKELLVYRKKKSESTDSSKMSWKKERTLSAKNTEGGSFFKTVEQTMKKTSSNSLMMDCKENIKQQELPYKTVKKPQPTDQRRKLLASFK